MTRATHSTDCHPDTFFPSGLPLLSLRKLFAPAANSDTPQLNADPFRCSGRNHLKAIPIYPEDVPPHPPTHTFISHAAMVQPAIAKAAGGGCGGSCQCSKGSRADNQAAGSGATVCGMDGVTVSAKQLDLLLPRATNSSALPVMWLCSCSCPSCNCNEQYNVSGALPPYPSPPP